MKLTFLSSCVAGAWLGLAALAPAQIGAEKGLPVRLSPGQEFSLTPAELFEHGKHVFAANWTVQEGQGRPLAKGTGAPLADPGSPLVFPHDLNRVSGPDANSCAGCHNAPVTGGSGDFATNAFVLGDRFDFATFDESDLVPTKGNVDENGLETTLQSIANSRQTLGMFGSGLIEMLARQITADLQAQRDTLEPGESIELVSKGISFGTLYRDLGGMWHEDLIEGLPPASITTFAGFLPPTLIVQPFHQVGAVVSLRQFTNDAYVRHHGIQTTERFGAGADPDQDGVADELGIADVTAASVFQAALDVPGRLIPSDPTVRRAIRRGEGTFVAVGCAGCHIPSLPLGDEGWIFSEPSPYNPDGNLKLGDPYVAQFGALEVDLTDESLPGPRPQPQDGVLEVLAFTDFKLHDITSGPDDPNREKLDMHHAPGSPPFLAGNAHFLTARLWGLGNQMPYYHHGLYTTIRQAIDAHAGEAAEVMQAWGELEESQRLDVVEFLKSLQVLPSSAASGAIDEFGNPVTWPEFPWGAGQVAAARAGRG